MSDCEDTGCKSIWIGDIGETNLMARPNKGSLNESV